ncbi:MAG: L-erythro-3,5-diaminohexanoate dehydrogenase [Deltaproteobacteria bacterium 13_1_40CM_4_68_19]|nr:MAG: L-erythro-3,5-diaminohexanoate dehydrogenase [Deltaproteobacteria bacterium 13_1_40CM_4_68_19]OLD09996.1 MAG: L-erythro-3,5-diaminohexanoate dehydrogenase [Deltaproteobacteria bacterium 13_1_40CM_3_69_14]OLD45611.1 MAG: L-erythro-3,5-diaminohexanoate dehydrogenase [Chloroflexi bacterium 13_1_40CM_2_68_14]
MSDPYGLRRVVRPKGALPQQAEVIDPRLPLGPDELSIDVERLNIDAASFRQLQQECAGDVPRIASRIREIVAARGKMQNPVTGSGGMLIGRVAEIGAEHPARAELRRGDRIATLVSLTLTPLVLEEIQAVHPHAERIDVKGRAVLFASGPWARMPEDFPEATALAVLDVCGAPAWVARLASKGQRILVLGAGKSGSLACAQARQNGAHVTALDYRRDAVQRLVSDGLADAWIAADATKPLEVYAQTRGAFDLVVNCASVPGTEMASILSARDGGEVLFFSMATSFTAAALGAEGAGKDVRLTIGNGYAQGHAKLALDLVRGMPALQRIFGDRVA